MCLCLCCSCVSVCVCECFVIVAPSDFRQIKNFSLNARGLAVASNTSTCSALLCSLWLCGVSVRTVSTQTTPNLARDHDVAAAAAAAVVVVLSVFFACVIFAHQQCLCIGFSRVSQHRDTHSISISTQRSADVQLRATAESSSVFVKCDTAIKTFETGD